MKINLLTPSVYNKISAGEVVERPASIVKELVENSIDAGAKNIRIEITEGGIKNITISDDGCGIEKEDLVSAFLPHATSKISNEKDLESIESLGFRGEALASISAVCQVKLSSKPKENQIGYSIKVDGGSFGTIQEVARTNGTTITCSNLFFNTPVRAKFLRKPKTEEAEITNLIERFMLSNSDIAFQYYVDGKQVYNTISCSMSDIIYSIYGKEVYDNIIEVDYEESDIRVFGYITKPTISKANRTYQTLFINGRTVENYLISNCITNVYSSFLMKGRFPVYVLSITLPADSIDVNVHPSKKEVRFENPNKIFGIITRATEKALLSTNEIQSFISPTKEEIKEEKVEIKEEPINAPEVLEGKSFDPVAYGRAKMLEEIEFQKQMEREKQEMYERSKNPRIITPEELQHLTNLEMEADKGKKRKPMMFNFDQETTKFLSEIKSSTSEKFISASVKDEMKVLGTIFNTYIAIEFDDSIFFIDQHAAHERLLFDKLVKNINEGGSAAQPLLAPYSFSVGAKESLAIDNVMESLIKMGFEIEKKGYSYTILSIPYVLTNIDLISFVDDFVSESITFEKKASDYVHNKLCQTACKHAIKGGDSITKEECAYIIEEVKKGVMLCPHGRPITLIITKHEFEKMFKRIV